MSEVQPAIPKILQQQELDLPGVEPLSSEDRVARWLESQTDESEEVFIASLFLRDGSSRRRRAARWSKVRNVQAPFDTDWGWLILGGPEAVWLYEEAERGLVDGLFLASLLCSHAACERGLAGCLKYYEEYLDRDWTRWGLGPLVREALRMGLIDSPLAAKLDRVTELRKVSAHYKDIFTPNAVYTRLIEALPGGSPNSNEDAVDNLLEADAFLAFEAATELLRGDQGFARIRAN